MVRINYGAVARGAGRIALTNYANKQIDRSIQRRQWLNQSYMGGLSRSNTGRRAGPTERKYIDRPNASYPNNSTGLVSHIDIVAQGDGILQRNGKRWRDTILQIRGSVNCGATTIISKWANILIWDKFPNGTLPAVSDILTYASANSFINGDNSARFQVIRRWEGVVSGNTTTPTALSVTDFNYRVILPKFCVANCTAADTLGTIAGRQTGALLFVSSGMTAAGTEAPITTVTMRMAFEDY